MELIAGILILGAVIAALVCPRKLGRMLSQAMYEVIHPISKAWHDGKRGDGDGDRK
jgi:hypothetical protein